VWGHIYSKIIRQPFHGGYAANMGIQKFLFAELMGAILAIKIAIKNQCLARV